MRSGKRVIWMLVVIAITAFLAVPLASSAGEVACAEAGTFVFDPDSDGDQAGAVIFVCAGYLGDPPAEVCAGFEAGYLLPDGTSDGLGDFLCVAP